MKNYMNEPVDCTFTDEDVINEYLKFGDVKRTAAIFCLDSRDVKEILKRNGT